MSFKADKEARAKVGLSPVSLTSNFDQSVG